MSSPRHSLRILGWGPGRSRVSGFTLVELMLTLLVGVLAVALLFTWLGRERQHRGGARFIADLQEFATVFQDYKRLHRAWPPPSTGEIPVPRGMEEALVETNWAEPSPYGGRYDWDGRGAVMLTAFAPAFPLELTRAELLALDREFDDGNLATGRLRTGFNGWPVYLVEDKP